MNDTYEDNWRRFEESAAMVFPETRDGAGNTIPPRRVLVPIMGTGVRAHLLKGVSAPAGATNWQMLLEGVAHAAGVSAPAKGEGPTTVFEAMVQASRERLGSLRPFSKDEDEFIERHVSAWSRQNIDRFRDFSSVTARRSRLLDLRFADRVDLCFDDLMTAPGAGSRRGSFGLQAPETTCVAAGDCSERAWHAHGYNRSPRPDIVLGMHRYGRAVAMTLRAFQRYMHASRHLRGNPSTLHELNMHRDRTFDRIDVRHRHWLAAAIDAPVVFLGTGLSQSEWDMTWFLQMRTRLHANLPLRQRPWTFRLLTDKCAEIGQLERLSPGAPVYDLVVKGGWDEAWERFHLAARAKPVVSVYHY